VLKEAGGGDRLERHRSLRATVEWTLGLLDDAPRALFTRMGAFAGPVELEDIEAIAGEDGLDVLDALAGLRDVALVRRVEAGDGRVRFGLPEALRQIASGLLDAAPDSHVWRGAHARRQEEIAWAARTIGDSPGPVYRAAHAADAEAVVALRWARAAGDPVVARLVAARAMLLADTGRTREALELLGPLLESPSGDATADEQAIAAWAYAQLGAGCGEEALSAIERVLAVAVDPTTRAKAMMMRGIIRTFAGEHEAAVRDAHEATEIARGLGPALHSGALAMEGQARIFAGDLERAEEQLAEAERIGAPVDTARLWARATWRGDLAIRMGRPLEALEHYARSLEAAQEHGNAYQILLDLQSVACTHAVLGQDAETLELLGLAEAQAADVGATGPTIPPDTPGLEQLVAAEERLGAAADELKARGHAVAPGGRVTRACELARLVRAV
jgi:tetratricopeptide (TPR) repeat protein